MSKSESRKMTASLRIRCTDDDATLIREKADAAALSVSEFMRRAALNRRIVTRTDNRMITSLLQQGGLLKHLYSQMKPGMTTELSRDFADTLLEIRKTLRNLQTESVPAGVRKGDE